MTPKDESRRAFMRQSFRRFAKFGLSALDTSDKPKPGVATPQILAPKPPEAKWLNRQPVMEYARLGRTELMVSRFVLGCAAIRESNSDLVRIAIDQGVNFLDTAHNFGDSEVALSRALVGVRDRVWVCSKMSPFPYSADTEAAQHDPNAAMAFWDSLDSSLARLATDRIDCYLLQSIDSAWRVREPALEEAFLRAKDGGKIRYIGIETHHNVEAVVEAAIDAGHFDIIQIPVNPLNLARVSSLIEKARAKDIGVIGSMPSIGMIDPMELSLLELPAGFKMDQLALLYLLKNAACPAFVAHPDSAEALARLLPMAAFTPSVNATNEFQTIIDQELWPPCSLCGEIRNPSTKSLEAVYAAQYRLYDPWSASASTSGGESGAGFPQLICDTCQATLDAGRRDDPPGDREVFMNED